MDWIKAKLIAKKAWLWAKKFWWVIVIALLFVCAGLLGALTRNGAFLAGVLDLMDAKRSAHNQEMELEEEFKKRGEKLDKEKEAELKRLVDEGYNNPEKLAKDLADAFGIK